MAKKITDRKSMLSKGNKTPKSYLDTIDDYRDLRNFNLNKNRSGYSIFTNNGINPNNGGISIIINNTSFDTDAQLFFTNANITDTTQKLAVNTLVLALKGTNSGSVNFWSKSKAIYPYVGGTASTHKFNLKDPRDLDAAYRITWSGTITHNSNGITMDGATGFGDTNLNALTVFGVSAISFHTYCRSSTTGIWFATNSNNFDWSTNSLFSNGNSTGVAVTQKFSGMSSVIRPDASNIGGAQDGDDVGNLAKVFSSNGNSNFLVGKFSGGLNSDGNFAFNAVMDNLTTTECAILNDIVFEFQTTLNRASQLREMIFTGDSISQGTGASDHAHCYAALLSANKSLKETNNAVSGTPLESAITVISNNLYDTRTTRISFYRAQRKYLLIAHHANDVGYNTGNYTTANFISQGGTIIDLAITRGWPLSKIYVISGFNINVTGIYNTTTYGGITVSTSDQTRFDSFITASQTLATNKGVNFINLTGVYDKITETADGLHPNDSGHSKISTYLSNIIP